MDKVCFHKLNQLHVLFQMSSFKSGVLISIPYSAKVDMYDISVPSKAVWPKIGPGL